MLTTFNNLQLRIRTLHKQLDLPFRISNGVNSIRSSMQPENRTHNVRKSPMQTISIP